MRLLFITQKMHEQDAFALLWVRAFQNAGYDITVLCLEDRVSPQDFPVLSMGKEKGAAKPQQIIRFWRHIMTAKYDRVFVHMSPVWGMLGSWYWILRRIPVYLWYTHYKQSLSMRITGMYAKRLFCATPQSMPQYDNSPKKVVVGHGIDLSVWTKRSNRNVDPKKLLVVHRLSRSKRLELILHALQHLPEYTLDIYGIEAEKDYAEEMKRLTGKLSLTERVTFHGTVPMDQLPDVYASHRLILNMASETIDKTMLEAMTCGCYPVTTKANANAIGIPESPDDSPESIAAFVMQYAEHPPLDADAMYAVTERRHSLDRLIHKMNQYIHAGS